jgi:hypothetical protein
MEKIQTEPDHARHPAQASDTTLETHDNGADTLSTTAEKPVPTADDALTKTPSQAEQLGKSKVILVMGALCVCI